jgi:hypothetical protein
MPKIVRTEWYACSKCNVVDEVHIYADGGTDMPRGEFLSHGLRLDAMATGFKSEEDARRWLDSQATSEPR